MTPRVEVNRWLVLTNTISSVVTYGLSISVLLWLHQYLLRRVSTAEYSLYPLIVGLIAVVPVIGSVLLSGLGRFVVDAYARHDDERVVEVVSSATPPLVIASVLVLLAALIVGARIEYVLEVPAALHFDARVMLLVLALSAAARMVAAPFGVGLYVRQRFVLLNAIQLAGQILRLALLLVLLVGIETRVIWVAVAAAVSEISVTAVQCLVSRHAMPQIRFQRSAFRVSTMRELASFGTANLLLQVGPLVRISLQPVILNRLATPLDVACFGVGALAATEIQRVTALLTTPLQPAITALYSQGDFDGLRRAYLRGNRYGLWFILAAVIPLIVYRNEIIALYAGPKFALAASVLAGLVAAMPLRYACIMCGSILVAGGNQWPLAVRALTIQLLTLGLTLVLVGWAGWGAAGAAYATMLAGLLSPLLLWPLGQRTAQATWTAWLRETVLPSLPPAATGVALWLLARHVLQPASWLAVGGCVTVGFAGYAAVLLLFCLQRYERNDLRQMIDRVLRGRVRSVPLGGRAGMAEMSGDE